MSAHSRSFKTLFATSLLALGVSACDMGQPKQVQKLTKPPFETSKSIAIEKETNVAALPPAEEIPFAQKVNVFKNKTEMAKPKGLVTTNLFKDSVSDQGDRFAHLENAVQLLANKMQTIEPNLANLMKIDTDLTNITQQLNILVSEHDANEEVAVTYREARLEEPRTAIKPKVKPIQKSTSHIASKAPPSQKTLPDMVLSDIQNIRIADHADKTRLVFEANQKINMAINFEPNGRSILISANDGNIHINPTSFKGSSKLIKQAHIQDDMLLIKLSNPSGKIAQGYLPPSDTNPNHRFYIDLKEVDSI